MQDVHLTCRLEHLYALVDAMQAQCAAHLEEVTLLDWGCSYKKSMGYLVLEWAEQVDEVFLAQLTADATVENFCVYTIPCLPDDQCCLFEPAAV